MNPLVMWCRSAMRAGWHLMGMFLALMMTACTPQMQAVLAILPDGTFPALLGHMERVEDVNRKRIAELEARGDWEGLSRFADDNIAKDRSNAEWYLVAGYAYSQGKQHARAIERYSEAVRLEPDDAMGWTLLARAQRAAGQPERAVRTLESALLMTRESPPVFNELGDSYSALGRYDRALPAYESALKLEPRYAEAWLGAGRAFLQLRRVDEARKVVERLQALDPARAAELRAQLP